MSLQPQPLFKIEYVKSKRNYNYVSKENRQRLIRLVRQGMTIKNSASSLEIKYSAAKAIIKLDRKIIINSGIISKMHKSYHLKRQQSNV